MQIAIEHALTILNWHENLPKDEVPPRHIWEDSEGLEQWWKRLDAKKGDAAESDEDSELVDNDHARMFRKLTEEDDD